MQEQSLSIITIIAAAVLLLAVCWLVMRRWRTENLRKQFGEEYDRTVETRGGRSEAEADLLEREKRVKELDIRPLGPEERSRFQREWNDTKTLFVDSPVEAMIRADRLLTTVMKTRGYPMADFAGRHANLTVDHGDVAKHYLAGHEAAERATQGQASTEELRQGLRHYEVLFFDLANDTADTVSARPVSAPAEPPDQSDQ